MRKLIALSLAIVLAAMIAGTCSAKNLQPDGVWLKHARCIHLHESYDWHATRTWLGAPSVNHGGLQINVGTWQSMLRLYPRAVREYPSDPAYATPWQQYRVGYLIWLTNGHRFGGTQWPVSSRKCGVA